MLFLDFNLFKPETWLSGAADGIMGTILSGIRTLLFNICIVIYELIVNVYNLFEKLCNARILDNKIIGIMAQRIGVVLGLVMFFYVVFSLIQMLIDPDKVADKEKGAIQIVKKALIVVVMLGVSTFFFEAAFGLQKTIINSDVISKVLLPYNIEGLEENKFGNLLSVNLMNSFYQINPDIENGAVTVPEPQGSNNYDECKSYLEAFRNQIYEDNRYDLGYVCLNASVDVQRTDEDGQVLKDQAYVINFNGFIAPLVGGFTVYLLLMYCFKIGVRMIQLAFLEIISPMAIVSYLSPKKDTMFAKWWKIYFATYIDVFIRIAIINLVVFLICTIYSTDTASGTLIFWETVGAETGAEHTFFSVVIVLALLTFAKKAPDLIKELLPASASKLGFGASLKDIVGLEKGVKWATKTAGGILGGAAAGAAIGLLGGGLGGFAGGLLKGSLSGLKGQGLKKTASSAWKSQQATNERIRAWKAAGGTNPFGRWMTGIQQNFGIETEAERIKFDDKKLEDDNKELSKFTQLYKDIDSRAEKKILEGSFNQNSNARAVLTSKRKLEMLQGQLNGLKKESFILYNAAGENIGFDQKAYDDEVRRINAEMNTTQSEYKANLDAAKDDYYSSSNDSVIEQAKSKIEAAASHKSFSDINIDMTNISTLKASDGRVQNKITRNANEITRRNNTERARKAKANAQHSGRSGKSH